MADLDLFGEEWSSMSDNFKTNIIKKASIVLNQLGGKIKTVVNDNPLLINRIVQSEWRSLPTEIQVKLYQAGRVKEDSGQKCNCGHPWSSHTGGVRETERVVWCSKCPCKKFMPIKEDSEPIWKDTNLRPDNMESKLTEIQASAETESKLKEFYSLSQKLSTLTKEVKALQSQMGGLEEDITSELERAEDNVLETKKFFAKIQRKGYDRENVKYKEAFDFLLGKVNPAIKKIAEDALEATKSISKVKASIAVGQQGKPMMEAVRIWDKIKNILRGIARKIAGVNDYWEQALAQVNAKMVESTVKKTVTELYESGSKE